MMRLVFLAIPLVAIVACSKPDPTIEEQIEQAEAKSREAIADAVAARAKVTGEVILLKEHEGIRIWKFWDLNTYKWVYFTSRADVQWSESCGKGCTRTHNVEGAK
jgi:hypothetical protein